MAFFKLSAAFLVAFLALATATSGSKYGQYYTSRRACYGKVKYSVTFYMNWTKKRFGDTVPMNAMISPLTAAAHKSRFSPFTMYGYASPEVEKVAESGNNGPLVAMLKRKSMVGDVAYLSKPTSNKGRASVSLYANAKMGYTHISAIAMLAPTPDWIAAKNNIDLCVHGKWAYKIAGPLYGYDAGTEKTIGVDQQPRQNIYRLQKPRYPRYGKYPVGWYVIKVVY